MWVLIQAVFAALTDGIGPGTWKTLLGNLTRLLFPPGEAAPAMRQSVDKQWAWDALADDGSTAGLRSGVWGPIFMWVLQLLLDRVSEGESESLGAEAGIADGGAGLRHDEESEADSEEFGAELKEIML